MSKRPELTIFYDADNLPASAKCSACGEGMPTAYPRTASAEIIEWFAAHFEIHKGLHPVQNAEFETEDAP
jgi:hypothetical protein